MGFGPKIKYWVGGMGVLDLTSDMPSIKSNKPQPQQSGSHTSDQRQLMKEVAEEMSARLLDDLQKRGLIGPQVIKIIGQHHETLEKLSRVDIDDTLIDVGISTEGLESAPDQKIAANIIEEDQSISEAKKKLKALLKK